jgi:hypothetical protein
MKVILIVFEIVVHLVFLKAIIIGSNYDFIHRRYR